MPQKGSILVVEDSPTQSMYLKFLLEENGYAVHLARDGREGLDSAKRKRPQLIISDVMMPRMTGYEICRAIKDDPEPSAIPLILLTTLSDPEDILKGVEAKADFYLTKPFDETALLSRVRDILNHALELKKDERCEELEIVVRWKRVCRGGGRGSQPGGTVQGGHFTGQRDPWGDSESHQYGGDGYRRRLQADRSGAATGPLHGGDHRGH